MKHITILAVLALFLMGACGPQNIRYSEKIKGNEIRAALYVKPVPEPINDINVWGRYSLGPDDNFTPAGKEERKIKQLFASSGFRNILLNNIRASERDLKGIMSLEITDNGFENADHASIAQAMTDRTNLTGFNSVKNRSSSRYLLAVSVDLWGYNYNNYRGLPSCYYDLEMTAELIDMTTGETLWRRFPRTLDVIHVAPTECEPEARLMQDALDRAVKRQMKALIDHIKEKP